MYAAKRFSCGPGAERRDPTKQFYIIMFIYDTVILGMIPVVPPKSNRLQPWEYAAPSVFRMGRLSVIEDPTVTWSGAVIFSD